MNKPELELDITKNIKMIEKLKALLLTHTADLFTALAETPQSTERRSGIFADLIITSWLLSGKLGISPADLEKKILTRLKAGVLEGSSTELYSELSALIRHMEGKR